MESEAGLARLLEAARGGDSEALEQLLLTVEPRVFRFGLKMCRNREDAHEVLQETLLAAAQSVGNFRGASSLSTWLFSIARNACAKMRRRLKGAPSPDQTVALDVDSDLPVLLDTARNPEEQLAYDEMQQALEAGIATLEPANREILILRDVEGLRASEVAEVVGLSVPATKSRLHRARLSVRDAVERVLREPAPLRRPGCPDVLNAFSRHLEGEIDADACSAMERHVENCPSCRGTCDSLKQVLAACRDQPAPPVSPEIQKAVRRSVRDFLRQGEV